MNGKDLPLKIYGINSEKSSKFLLNVDFTQAYIEVNYMTDYPIPADFGVALASEYEDDEALNDWGHFELHGYPIPMSGWQSDIIDFKVLSK